MLQGLLAGLVMLLPLAQCCVDQGAPAQQFAAQDLAGLLLLFQFAQGGLQPHSGQVLAAFGVEVGKRLVPFSLEVDAGIRQVTPENLQQIVLYLAGAQFVQAQCAGQHPLKNAGIAGMLQPENAEVLLTGELAVAPAIHHVGKFAAAVAEHPAPKARQMVGQLRLCHQGAIRQAELLDLQRPGIGEILVLEAHPFAHAAQHDGAGLRQRHLQQHIGAVVGEIEAPALVHIVRPEIHTATVDDQQKLQGIDQAGLAGVVGRHQRDRTIERQLGARVAGTPQQDQTLEAVLHQVFSSSSGASAVQSSAADVLSSSPSVLAVNARLSK